MALITESDWNRIRATLPGGVDETWFRGALECIASEPTVSPKKQEGIYLNRARSCADLIRYLPGMEHLNVNDALLEQLNRQQQADTIRGRFNGRIAAQKRPTRFLRQCGILHLWERAGGSLRTTTRIKKRSDTCHPQPTGAVILYFQAAATAICGKAPRAHHIKRMIREYRSHFRPASSLISSSAAVKVNATSVYQGSVHIVSSTQVRGDGKSVHQASTHIISSTQITGDDASVHQCSQIATSTVEMPMRIER